LKAITRKTAGGVDKPIMVRFNQRKKENEDVVVVVVVVDLVFVEI